jgi:hypothetical protein
MIKEEPHEHWQSIISHPVNRLVELLPDQWKALAKDEHGLIFQP